MKIPFPAFIKRIFETPAIDNNMFDVRSTKTVNTSASSTRQFVMMPTLEKKSLGVHPPEQQSTSRKHWSTPIPETPAFLRNNHKHVSFSKNLTSVMLNQEMRSFVATALSTPMVISSLGSLESVTTPADAFPDILEIIDQAWPVNFCETSPLINASSRVNSIPDSVFAPETPRNELELIEILITVADQIESEKNVSNKSNVYTRPEDVLLSRTNGQRKCQHAKRMTEDEKQYYKNNRSCRTKEKMKQTCDPVHGVRRSSRIKKNIQYIH